MSDHREQPATPLDAGERAELERLRAEVATLRASAASLSSGGEASDGAASGSGARPARRRHDARWVRWTASVVVLAIAAVLSIVTVSARFVRGELLDTDRYVQTVAPLGSDPAVQDAVAAKVTDAIQQQLDLQALTTQALTALTEAAPRVPDGLVGLAPVLANQANGFIASRVSSFVHSEQFATLWTNANQAAHRNLVSLLTGEGETALTANGNGEVSVQLGPVIDAVKERLTAQGLTFAASIPEIDKSFVVFTSPDVAKAQRWVRFLDHAANWLVWVTVGLAAVGIAIAPRGSRRRATVLAGVFVALAMLLLAVAIAIGRAVYLGSVPADVLPPTTATVLFNTVVQPLRVALRAVLLVGLVVALAGFLVGPSTAAVAVRDGFMWLVGRASGGHAGATARLPRAWEVWVDRLRVVLTVVIVAVAALLLAFWHYPTGIVVFWVALVAVVLVVAVQVVAAPARAARRASGTPADPGADAPAVTP